MSFVDISKELLNKTLTENGDVAFKSSLSPCLDYFSLVGGKRNFPYDVFNLFLKAYYEDRNTALKLLFYTRDIKEGLGERRIFRLLFNSLCVSYPNIAKELVQFIPIYGRFDDLLCVLKTPVEDIAIELITKQLEEDLINKKLGKPISLLAKWLPSINTSNAEAREYALYLADKLNLSKADYRKTLSYLRDGLIIENNLRLSQYDFDYSSVPSLAFNKYHKAFERNDTFRFNQFIGKVSHGEEKMHVDVLDVTKYVREIKRDIISNTCKSNEYYEAAWKELTKDASINKRTIVVRDGSASMTWIFNSSTSSLDIADAMTLLTAERLEGEFHNRFITFSEHPEFVDLSNVDGIVDKLKILQTHDDCSNTNIEKVYKLILDVYKHPDFKKEDMLEQILIISDMEFDVLSTDKDISTFEYFKKEFESLDCPLPEIIFWNVMARSNHLPVTKNEEGVKIISGDSKNVIDIVMMNESLNPLEFMYRVLEKYHFIDDIKFEE